MTVSITDGFYVQIREDYELVSAFLQWKMDNHICTMGSGSCGRGGYNYFHFIEDKPAIEKFFKDYKSTKDA